MNIAARLAPSIAIVILALSAPPAVADPEQVADPVSYEVTVVNATAEQQAMAEWVLDHYEVAGLPIPAVTITFHQTSDGCRGFLGFYDATPKTLDICNWGQHYKITPASTLLHELAHAWSFAHMTEADRSEFTAHQGLDHWHHDGPWWHMGQEQAAEIIAWGVGGDRFASPYLHGDCDELSQAYELMTGTQPLHSGCSTAT